MSAAYPAKHDAVVTPGKRIPLRVIEVETVAPKAGEVVVRVEWTSSSPLDLHRADGGLLCTPLPFIIGSSFAGTVVATGPEDPAATKPISAPIQLNDKVFGLSEQEQKQQGFQTYVTVPRHILGRIPPNLTIQEAITAPTNLVTAVHTVTKDLQLELPWPRPQGWTPKQEHEPILIWGAASSVGLFTVQVLQHWGYKNIIAVASARHHETLAGLGAAKCFDYKEENVTDQIAAAVAAPIHLIVDCIGHLDGTLRPLTKLAVRDTKVAIMMPAILRDATDEHEPELSMDPSTLLKGLWAEGVKLIGVRTFFYAEVRIIHSQEYDL